VKNEFNDGYNNKFNFDEFDRNISPKHMSSIKSRDRIISPLKMEHDDIRGQAAKAFRESLKFSRSICNLSTTHNFSAKKENHGLKHSSTKFNYSTFIQPNDRIFEIAAEVPQEEHKGIIPYQRISETQDYANKVSTPSTRQVSEFRFA
jgi:hypothetical protein